MIVFIHGVPETAALWDNVRSKIDADSVALPMPGFGCELPSGFETTKDGYSDWLVNEIEAMGAPVDLVGHDWGAGLTYRVATARGDLLRSWAADVANIAHPDYVWHDFAKIWQTPGEGEAFFETQLSQPRTGDIFEAFGVPHDDAAAMASWLDETMAACILGLYRSATPNPYADWGSAFRPTTAPGCVLIPTEDPFGDDTMASEVAQTLGARVERLEGLGHWWPLQDPGTAAAVLQRFWSDVPGPGA